MDKISSIKQRLSEISLSINRVPLDIKRGFINLANAEFSGDYGMLLKWIFEQAIEYQSMKALFFDKLDSMETKINELINSKDISNEKKNTKPKRLGRRIEMKGGNKKDE